MGLREEIKAKIIKSGWTMSGVVNELNKRHSRNDSLQNLSNKLSRGTLKYTEVLEIADIIGCTIEWVPKIKA